jgi:hypothetical protein
MSESTSMAPSLPDGRPTYRELDDLFLPERHGRRDPHPWRPQHQAFGGHVFEPIDGRGASR